MHLSGFISFVKVSQAITETCCECLPMLPIISDGLEMHTASNCAILTWDKSAVKPTKALCKQQATVLTTVLLPRI